MSAAFSPHEHPGAHCNDCGPEEEHRLEVVDLHVHYGSICALEGVSFGATCCNAVALLGRNGAGKSTLLKALAGLAPHPAGSIRWRGEPLDRVHRRHEIAYLPQRSEVDWNFPVTVRGLVEMGRYPHVGFLNRFGADDVEAVDKAIESLQLADLQARQIRELSGGQQQRAFIARALAGGSHVILLDEPFAGLDIKAQALLAELIRELTDDNRLILASHHDLASTEDIFDEVLLLDRTLRAHGPAKEVMHGDELRTAFPSFASLRS